MGKKLFWEGLGKPFVLPKIAEVMPGWGGGLRRVIGKIKNALCYFRKR